MPQATLVNKPDGILASILALSPHAVNSPLSFIPTIKSSPHANDINFSPDCGTSVSECLFPYTEQELFCDLETKKSGPAHINSDFINESSLGYTEFIYSISAIIAASAVEGS